MYAAFGKMRVELKLAKCELLGATEHPFPASYLKFRITFTLLLRDYDFTTLQCVGGNETGMLVTL